MKQIVILLAALTLVGCAKQEPFQGQKQASTDSQIIVTATIENPATKVSFTEDAGTQIKAAWEADDRIIGWDENGRTFELAVENIRDNGAAEFAIVTGSLPLPTSGKVYMIYAPGKSLSDISDKSLEYDLTAQDGSEVPALMTATGIVAGNRLELRFNNELALVAVKSPKLPVTVATPVSGLKISGDNVNTVATFSMNGDVLEMTSSTPGTLTKACEFTTTETGESDTMVYFAVLPNSTPADVTVSTVNPEGYQNSYTGQTFTKGQCYIMDTQTIEKRKFSITIDENIQNGTVTTDPAGECAWGETVTVNAEPDEEQGYVVDVIKYNDGTTDYDITATRSFTMPHKDVTVTVIFRNVLLNGDFTVDDDGTIVHFSCGNLQFKAGDGTVAAPQWRFASEQYDFINGNPGNTTREGRETQADWIDLFGWGATGKNPYGQPPYSIVHNDLVFKTVENGNAGEKLTRENGGDWGVCIGEGWRTLSKDEWEYIIKRTVNNNTGEGYSYQRATINSDMSEGIYGLILYPDDYTAQTNETSYTSDQWSAMEMAGCVFLPASGYRSYYGKSNGGNYWSSTGSTWASVFAYAYWFIFTETVVHTEAMSRRCGLSVRLIKQIQNSVE